MNPSNGSRTVAFVIPHPYVDALACFREPSNENKPRHRVGVLMSQEVPLERIFMTYMETRQMNHPYRESEAVLLYDPDEAF